LCATFVLRTPTVRSSRKQRERERRAAINVFGHDKHSAVCGVACCTPAGGEPASRAKMAVLQLACSWCDQGGDRCAVMTMVGIEQLCGLLARCNMVLMHDAVHPAAGRWARRSCVPASIACSSLLWYVANICSFSGMLKSGSSLFSILCLSRPFCWQLSGLFLA
jgi:hypothetical protein